MASRKHISNQVYDYPASDRKPKTNSLSQKRKAIAIELKSLTQVSGYHLSCYT